MARRNVKPPVPACSGCTGVCHLMTCLTFIFNGKNSPEEVAELLEERRVANERLQAIINAAKEKRRAQRFALPAVA